MSRSRKHLLQAQEGGECGALGPAERVLRVLGPRGSNILEVEDADGLQLLVRMPQRFNKMLWVKRGSFVVACVAEVGGSADRVTGEVSRVLYADQIRALRRAGAWPQGFEDDGDGAAAAPSAEVGAEAKAEARQGAGGGGSGSESDDDGLPPLVANTNRAQPGVRPRGDSDDEGDDD